MSIFHLVFNPLFIVLPAIVSLFLRAKPEQDIDHANVRRLRIRLWSWTFVALVLFGLVVLLVAITPDEEGTWLHAWKKLPRIMTWGATPEELPWWVLFFPLWFGGAMRLLRELRPDIATPYVEKGNAMHTRTASLKNRTTENPIRTAHWTIGWVLWLGALIAMVARAITAEPDPSGPSLVLFLVLHASVVPIGLVIGPWAVRLSLQEPEPLDTSGSVELRDAYESYRRTKAWGFYGMTLVMTALISTVFVLVAYSLATGPALGLVGGIGGSLVGVAGAVFGTTMSIRRLRIKQQLERMAS